MGKIAIVSLGCPKNHVDSETLRESLAKEGFLSTSEPEGADLIFVNTCGFIEDAKRESIEEILRMKELKGKGGKLLVFGCLAKRYGVELRREIPEIDGLWGVGDDDKIVEYCRKMKAIGDRREAQAGNDVPLTHSPAPLATPSHAYLKIADGCNRGCTYCVIPSIRGPFRSSEPDRILRKAEEHVRSGAKELILVAQDIGSYGREFMGYGLPALVRDIASIGGDFWIRLLYLYPTAVTEELLSVLSEEGKVCKYLDIPLQHSEDRILKAMGRGCTKKLYREAIEKIREAIPDITLRTTMIVGFPGETEEDFSGMRRFVEEVRFDRLGVFTYSREEGTPAYGMKGNVRKGIKEMRRDEIMRIQSGISLEKNLSLVGKRYRALVDEVDESAIVARLSSQAPEIDGVVIISDFGFRISDSESRDSAIGNPQSVMVSAGDFVTVEIAEAYDYDVRGVVITDDRGSRISDSKSLNPQSAICNPQ